SFDEPCAFAAIESELFGSAVAIDDEERCVRGARDDASSGQATAIRSDRKLVDGEGLAARWIVDEPVLAPEDDVVAVGIDELERGERPARDRERLDELEIAQPRPDATLEHANLVTHGIVGRRASVGEEKRDEAMVERRADEGLVRLGFDAFERPEVVRVEDVRAAARDPEEPGSVGKKQKAGDGSRERALDLRGSFARAPRRARGEVEDLVRDARVDLAALRSNEAHRPGGRGVETACLR